MIPVNEVVLQSFTFLFADGACMYKDVPLTTEAGPITSTISNASIA